MINFWAAISQYGENQFTDHSTILDYLRNRCLQFVIHLVATNSDVIASILQILQSSVAQTWKGIRETVTGGGKSINFHSDRYFC